MTADLTPAPDLGAWPAETPPLVTDADCRLIGSGDGSVMAYCGACRSCLSPRVATLGSAAGVWAQHVDRTHHRPAAVPDPADVEKAAQAVQSAAEGHLLTVMADLLRLTYSVQLDTYPSKDARREAERVADAFRERISRHAREAQRRRVAALAAVRPSPDSEAVARVEALARVLVDAPGQGPLAAALIFGALAGGDAAKLAEYERAALGTGDREGADRG